jgi:uncharacterized protein (DUF2252 family)
LLVRPCFVTGAIAMRVPLLVALALSFVGCSESADDARTAELTSVLARADQSLIRARPALTAGKYGTMAASLHSYHRGSLSIFEHDFRADTDGLSDSRFALDGPLVLGVGDPHFENFGVLVAGDGTLAIEPNDFDSAERVPYLWDVRRLAVGMALAASVSNPNAPAIRASVVAEEWSIARGVADGYAQAIGELAAGVAPRRFVAPQSNPILADALSRSEGDLAEREELAELTSLANGKRTLLRGVPDPTEPTEVLAELPEFVRDALPLAVAEYRHTLTNPPSSEYFTLLDAVRVFGRGVASLPRVRIFLLVRGPSDDALDDVILELRELADSGIGGWYPPGEYFDTVGDRILWTSRSAWARPDAAPLWGVSSLLGLPVQVRWESEGQKTLRVRRLEGNLGSVDAIRGLAVELGRLMARVHATPTDDAENPAARIRDRIAEDPDGFADEQADAAVRYAARVSDDFPRFQRVLEDVGPTLGVRVTIDDAPSADLALLYGTPPVSP